MSREQPPHLFAAALAAAFVTGATPGSASPQEVARPLSELFPITGELILDARGGETLAPTRPRPPSSIVDSMQGPGNDGTCGSTCGVLTGISAVGGDLFGGAMVMGCLIACRRNDNVLAYLGGGVAIAIGTPVLVATVGGGDFVETLRGSTLGFVAGGAAWTGLALTGGEALNVLGFIAFLVTHSTMTARSARR